MGWRDLLSVYDPGVSSNPLAPRMHDATLLRGKKNVSRVRLSDRLLPPRQMEDAVVNWVEHQDSEDVSAEVCGYRMSAGAKLLFPSS